MENKLKILKSNKAKAVIAIARNVAGQAVMAALSAAYIGQRINHVSHHASLLIGMLVIGLLLYFSNANN